MDFDLRLRLALFQHIDRLRRESGGVVTSAQLGHGFAFEGERIPIRNPQAGIHRPKQLRKHGSEAALTIVTTIDSPYDDRADPEDDRFVYRYQGQDTDNWQNVALRRAMEMGRPVLYLVEVKPTVYQPVFPTYVVGDIPERLAFMLLADAVGALRPEAIDPDPLSPVKRYATVEAKKRLHQERFRYVVLKAYGRRCAMCSLRHEPLLDAAHILPDRDERGNPEVPNGLSLCRIHHGAYDVGIVGIDPDYVIHVRRDVLEEVDGPMLRHGLQDLHAERLRALPRRAQDKPSRDFLAERFEAFRVA